MYNKLKNELNKSARRILSGTIICDGDDSNYTALLDGGILLAIVAVIVKMLMAGHVIISVALLIATLIIVLRLFYNLLLR